MPSANNVHLPAGPPPSLFSLPPEIISHIVDLLPDNMTARVFAKTCRAAAAATDARIWREVDVSPLRGVRELRLLEVHPPLRIIGHVSENSLKGAWEEERSRRTEARARAIEVLGRGSERRWGFVESLTVDVRPGAIPPVLAILQHASATVKSLTFNSICVEPRYMEAIRRKDHEAIDIKLIDAGLSFPSLTRLHLQWGSIRYPEILPVLFNSAPNIKSLDMVLEGNPGALWSGDTPLPPYPDFLGNTKLEALYMRCDNVQFGQRDRVVTSLLERSPHIRQFCLDTDGGCSDMTPSFVTAVGRLQHLTDLFWRSPPGPLYAVQMSSDKLFPNLQRLLIQASSWTDRLGGFPDFSDLEILFIDYSMIDDRESELASLAYPPPASVQHLTGSLIETLLGCPRLASITFLTGLDLESLDECIRLADGYAGDDVGSVTTSSFRNDRSASELVVAWVTMCEIEEGDAAKRLQHDPDWLQPRKRILYTHEELYRQGQVKWYSEPAGQWFSDFEGLAVPMEVIGDMIQVDGRMWNERSYVGHRGVRGVVVSDGAWDVLTVWRDGAEADLDDPADAAAWSH